MFKVLKVALMSLLAWLSLIVLLNLFMHMANDELYDFNSAVEMLPVTALLCIPPTGLMVIDYLRKN